MTTMTDTTFSTSITLRVPVERAFAVFTEGFNSWWPRDHHIGTSEMAEAATARPGSTSAPGSRDRRVGVVSSSGTPTSPGARRPGAGERSAAHLAEAQCRDERRRDL